MDRFLHRRAVELKKILVPALALAAIAGLVVLALVLFLGRNKIAYAWNGSAYEKIDSLNFVVRATILENDFFVAAKNGISKNTDRDFFAGDYRLQNGRLKFKAASGAVWRTPSEWRVDEFAVADSTGDGIPELNLSVWKAGDFGTAQPSWVKENDPSVKNHFFVMKRSGDGFAPAWQSSNLDAPNCEFLFSDLDGDGKEELAVIEGSYGDKTCTGKYLAVWKWNGWGFANEWRSPPGCYEKLRIESGKVLVASTCAEKSSNYGT